MLLFVILGVAIAITLFIVFQITVVRPIRDLRTDIASITGSMDYSMRAQIRNQDEIGALSRDFNTMLGLIEANNQELKQLSETDPLTGLFNRLAMDKKLQQAWHLLIRTSDPLTVMLVDIDYFKAYNDHYGHQAGDDCLKKVAQILQNAAKRDSDMVARYGGEEFLIVLPGTSRASAQNIAAVLQQHIAEENIEHSASSVDSRVTVSIGIAAQAPSPAESVSELIGAADRALYQAKENGRNRIE
jgi:diguanylate cyclase (GGDEF)-like protein